MGSPPEFAMGPCGCCGEPKQCLLVWCCPCFAYCQAAENIGLEAPPIYFAAPFLGLSCCAVCYIGTKVAEKRGIPNHDILTASVCAFFDPCICYSCTIVNECRMYKENAPSSQKVLR